MHFSTLRGFTVLLANRFRAAIVIFMTPIDSHQFQDRFIQQWKYQFTAMVKILISVNLQHECIKMLQLQINDPNLLGRNFTSNKAD